MKHAFLCVSGMVAIIAGSLCATASAQTTWHVDVDNCPGPGAGSVADPFCSIQDAIIAAATGDEIIVQPGIYEENLNFLGKGLVLRSSDQVGPWVVGSTIIDANSQTDAIRCDFGEPAGTSIAGFTIREAHGSGILIGSNAQVIVRRCVFRDNVNPNQGVNPPYGGGISVYDDGSANISHCNFQDNFGPRGGGISAITVGQVDISDCEFVHNEALYGGGVYLDLFTPASVRSCRFTENVGVENSGAMSCRGKLSEITDCTFIKNETHYSGGALSLGVGNSGDPALIQRCIFLGNSAHPTDGSGGAVACSYAKVVFLNCLFSGNSSWVGGGVKNFGVYSTLINCSFANNVAKNGTSIHTSGGNDIAIRNCNLWDSGRVIYKGHGAFTRISYSNYQGTLQGGVIDEGGNISINPQFVDADGPDNIPGTIDDDLRLLATSPCIDAGDNTVAELQDVEVDLDNNPRFLDRPETPDTGVGPPPFIDMGAYEFPGVSGPFCPADLTDNGTKSQPDGEVNTFDLLAILSNWNTDGPGANLAGPSNVVNVFDLLVLLSAWGDCPD